MEANIQFITTQVLGEVNKTGIAVFQYVIYQLLYHSENDQFLIGMQPFAIIVKAATGVHAARTAYFLKQIVHCRFESEIFKGRGHQAMRNISNKLNGIVDNLFGVVNALKLGGFIEVNEV